MSNGEIPFFDHNMTPGEVTLPPMIPPSLTVTLPEILEPFKDDLRRFIDAMVYKLAKNAHKGRWEAMDLAAALGRLRDEVTELDEAIDVKRNMVEILLEAADVANFAMIAAAIAIEKGNR